MNIGDRYNESQNFRGSKHYNNRPLLAEDIHEFSDTIYNKLSKLFGNTLGSGLIQNLDIVTSQLGIRLRSPAILHIEGDICILKNSDDKYLSSMSELYNTSIRDGILYIVGWYQHMNHSTTMREYGGVRNNEVDNPMLDNPLKSEVSTRYQFIWDTVAIHGSLPGEYETPNIQIPVRDSNGNLLTGNYSLSNIRKLDSIYKADAPASMDYVVGDIYIIPLIIYRTAESTGEIVESKNVPIRSMSPESIYLETYEFIDIASTNTDTRDITFSLSSLPDFIEGDILIVTYDGLCLTENYDYVINKSSKQLTLLNFSREIGERLHVKLERVKY